ncbi:GNAT family N-acetyltransferase [Nocardia higoensis]|uniref:GNAT family N-acetyltransferase n=1 Tax=Nocardia higoensis TaxID=228599 RepID=A0ABS0DFG2_9NOCA|nr:GNAT family N-acetyltransferase [Nocardia higoensis]MBF6357207.1 GNAT family N-acetyltransferase [Nocardia higoensis]
MRVRRADAADVEAVGRAYAAGAQDEAVTAWVTEGYPDVAAAFRAEHAPKVIERAVREDEVWVAGPEQEVWSVSVWHHVTAVDRYEAEAREIAEMASTASRIRPMVRLAAVTALVARTHPREFPHRYLQSIVTVPQHRGRGAGAAILAARLSEAAEPVYLEASTERSAALYERCGFVRTGGAFALPDGGPVLIPMWFRGRSPARDAQTSAG